MIQLWRKKNYSRHIGLKRWISHSLEEVWFSNHIDEESKFIDFNLFHREFINHIKLGTPYLDFLCAISFIIKYFKFSISTQLMRKHTPCNKINVIKNEILIMILTSESPNHYHGWLQEVIILAVYHIGTSVIEPSKPCFYKNGSNLWGWGGRLQIRRFGYESKFSQKFRNIINLSLWWAENGGVHLFI